MRLKISARKSDLARLQAYTVGERLQKAHPQLEIEYRFKESLGDKNLTDPLWKIPEKGVFTEDFLGELISGETDLVVHSWKDLPTECKNKTTIAATLPRADQRDLFLFKKSHLEKVKASKRLRTFSSSPRREYNLGPFLKEHFPGTLKQVDFLSVRGNIPTRIRKLIEDPEVDALVVAKAALDRLLSAAQSEFQEVIAGLTAHMHQLNWMALPLSINPNAAAQGALAIETLESRTDLHTLLQPIHDHQTFYSSQKEREILSAYGGGCHQRIGVSILNRPYGEICFVKGLTNSGEVLDRKELFSQNPLEKFNATEMRAIETTGKRILNLNSEIPADINALYISRTEAWIESLNHPYLTWTAGVKTWKNLAKKGIWIHGCSEGLGEDENPLIDVIGKASGLLGAKAVWAKLTHQNGYKSEKGFADGRTAIATYELQLEMDDAQLNNQRSFFWSSGSQFLALADKHPKIWTQYHACGPGHTYKIIRSYLEEKNAFDSSRLQVFLDQQDWRKKCQI